MASQGKPGKLEKSEGLETSKGVRATPDATCSVAQQSARMRKEEGT
jgi:hypothetical protein